MGGILVCLLMGLMIFGIVMIFVPYSKYMQMVYGGAGAILFSFYLVYDTQMMMGGSHKYSISPEEYVFAGGKDCKMLILILDEICMFHTFSPGSVSGHHQHLPLRSQICWSCQERLKCIYTIGNHSIQHH